MPDQYRPQVQGLLMITGRSYCDFWAWHPEVPPFLIQVEADPAFQEKIAQGLVLLLDEIKTIEEKMQSWLP